MKAITRFFSPFGPLGPLGAGLLFGVSVCFAAPPLLWLLFKWAELFFGPMR